MKLTKTILYFVTIGSITVLSFFFGFLSSETMQLTKAKLEQEASRLLGKAPAIEVAYRSLQPQPYQEKLQYTGTVTPWRIARLAFAEPGIVKSLQVDIGDYIQGPKGDEEGQALAAQDLDTIQAMTKAALADLEKARWDREQVTKLHAQGTTSEEEVKRAKLVFDLKEAELTRAKKSLRNTVLRAPFSGVITDRYIEKGEAAGPQTPAFRLTQLDPIKVLVNIPGRLINEVRPNQKTEITVETTRGRSQSLAGRVYRVPPSAQGHLFSVEISVPNPKGVLKEGMIVRAKIATKLVPRMYILPLETVIEQDDKRLVMLYLPNTPVIDGRFDLALLPEGKAETILEALGIKKISKTWQPISQNKWNQLDLTARERLQAKAASPLASALIGSGVEIFHPGCTAKERVLKNSRIVGEICLVPDDGTFKAGEYLITRGQHRVASGVEVVLAEKNVLPPLDGAEPSKKNKKNANR